MNSYFGRYGTTESEDEPSAMTDEQFLLGAIRMHFRPSQVLLEKRRSARRDEGDRRMLRLKLRARENILNRDAVKHRISLEKRSGIRRVAYRRYRRRWTQRSA